MLYLHIDSSRIEISKGDGCSVRSVNGISRAYNTITDKRRTTTTDGKKIRERESLEVTEIIDRRNRINISNTDGKTRQI